MRFDIHFPVRLQKIKMLNFFNKIKSAKLRGKVTLGGGGNIISALSYADDLVLFGTPEQEFQNSISDLEATCTMA